jgi:hypothetical protein
MIVSGYHFTESFIDRWYLGLVVSSMAENGLRFYRNLSILDTPEQLGSSCKFLVSVCYGLVRMHPTIPVDLSTFAIGNIVHLITVRPILTLPSWYLTYLFELLLYRRLMGSRHCFFQLAEPPQYDERKETAIPQSSHLILQT